MDMVLMLANSHILLRGISLKDMNLLGMTTRDLARVKAKED